MQICVEKSGDHQKLYFYAEKVPLAELNDKGLKSNENLENVDPDSSVNFSEQWNDYQKDVKCNTVCKYLYDFD